MKSEIRNPKSEEPSQARWLGPCGVTRTRHRRRFAMSGLQWLGVVAGMTLSPAPAAQGVLPGMAVWTPKEQRVTLTLHTNGTSLLQQETVLSREMAQRTVRMLQVFKRMQDMAEAGGIPEPPGSADPDASQAMSDADLVTQLKELATESEFQDGSGQGLASVELLGEDVRTVMTNAFETLENLAGSDAWRQMLWGAPLQGLTLASQTNGNLQLTLEPWTEPGQARYYRQMFDRWKTSGVQNGLQLIMPGKILSSSLPDTSDRTTSYTLTATNDASLATFRSLTATSIVVVAESGGLHLAQPVDSRKVRQDNFAPGAQQYSDLPLQEAAPGYLAEPDSVEVTTTYRFPDGTNLWERLDDIGLQADGVNVRGRLFAPRGRTLLAVNRVHVLKATDDQGRELAVGSSEDEEYAGTRRFVDSDGEDASAQLDLQLGLPEPDAGAIEEISAEAEVVTAGSWKQMELTRLDSLPGQSVELSEILPGATATLQKPAKEGEPEAPMKRLELTLKLEGPREIRAIKVECKSPDAENQHFSVYDLNSSTGKTNSVRQVRIMGYSFADGSSPDLKSVRLILSYPEDLRRERVPFKLLGMDLF